MTPHSIIAIYLAAINLITLMAYGWDKHKARTGKWRTPESTLLLLAAVGGSIGALLGMRMFRHKTQHLKFTLGVPAILIIQIALAVCIYLKFCHTP